MQSFKEKFAVNLQNAERILEQMRQTHRQRIQQAHSSSESDRKGDHTFESPAEQPRGARPRPASVADKLQQDFLRRTYHQYLSDLELITENEQNVLMAMERVVERLNYLADSEDIIQKLTKKNSALDEEIREYERESEELERRLTREGFAEMRLVDQTQRHVRNLLNQLASPEDDCYVGFANKWNSYLEELAAKTNVDDPAKLDGLAAEQATKTISSSFVSDAEPSKPAPPPTIAKKKSEINSELLGNLKEVSKNLKLPTKK